MGTKLCKRIACMLFFAMMLNPIGISEEVYGDTPAHLVAPAELGEIDLPMDETVPDDDITVEVSSSTEVFESEAYTATEELLSVESTDEFAVAAPAGFQTALTLGVKEQYMLDGASLADGQSVTYISDKPKIVNVDAYGTVTARKKGTAIISCYIGDAEVGNCTVTVLKAPKKLTFAEKSVVISKDQTLAYPAIMPKGCGGSISYSSDNPDVLSVDATGNLQGISGGTATLTAVAYNGKKAKCSIRVLGGPAPSWVALNETSISMPIKGNVQLAASFDEGSDALLTYTTSDKKVVKVSETGLVTARKAGNAMVTVTTHNGLTATCDVQVYTSPKKVTLNTTKVTLYTNDGYQLTATLTKNSIAEINWTSDNPEVASVDEYGFVIAESIGKATITATTDNGKRAKCKVTVKERENSGTVADGVRGTVIHHEESDTLKVTIANDKGVYLTYIWAKDPSRQLYKHYGNSQPGNMLQDAVNASGLQSKIVVGFNASPPVNTTYYPDWNKDTNYRHREPSPLMIANGEVLVNDPYKSNEEKYLYWVDGNGQLRHSGRRIEVMTVEERAALYSEVISSGARNTMIWQPVLISDHQATYLSADFLKKKAGKQKKQALCQMDDNSFILVSSSESGKMTYPEFQKYLMGLGCKTAVEFDAGGSTSLLWKSKDSKTVQRVTGGGRSLTMVMYFTE